MRLAGKKAVVTGAGGHGIGRAIVDAFVEEGADVAVIDIQAPPDESSDQVPHFQLDVSDAVLFTETLGRAWERLGSVDVLVNAAGITHRKPFLDLTLDEWDEVHSINLRPYFVGTQWLARELVRRQLPGAVLNIASINGSIATPGQAHYGAAKGGVLSLTRAAAVELASYGVRVNAISPGCVETDLNRDLLSTEDFRAMRTAAIPLNRVGVPRDIAPAAVFLASDDAGFITGADYLIDGGQVVW